MRRAVIGLMFWAWVAAAGACASAASDGAAGAAGPPAQPPGDSPGVCADSCPKACADDDECDTADGELCCDYAEHGKACVSAPMCPRFCDDDSRCNLQSGEACLRPTLDAPQRICMPPDDAVRTCSDDSGCGAGEECCTNYKEPVCLPPGLCPKACAQSSECDTQRGEICCTTLPQVDATLGVAGLCVHVSEQACPRTCQQSSDCQTAEGEICCDGVCATSCPKSCETSNECNGQICCTSPVIRSPWLEAPRAPGYHTGGGTCPLELQHNGACDEPSPCPPGTDDYDCAAPGCAYEYDGVCDEPEGTGLCAQGSDAYDCAGNGGTCASCYDWMYLGASPEDMCASSYAKAEELMNCACAYDCADDCYSACYYGEASDSCDACVYSLCVAEVNACENDT